MRIKITNEDGARYAEVTDEQFTIGNTSPDRTDTVLLAPSESRDFWIHTARRLTVVEKP